jgi:putative membrane protein insertion efficiency factor
MRRRGGWNDPYGGGYPPRRGGGWFIGSPFGVGGGFGGGFGPRYRRGYGGGYGGGGGGCMRDACLLESGCCLAESLDGNCLLLALTALPSLLLAFVLPSRRTSRSGLLLSLIAAYRSTISPRRTRPVCRFTPSCSAYAAEAIERHGTARGVRLAGGRLLRCRPGGRRGADPVPG